MLQGRRILTALVILLKREPSPPQWVPSPLASGLLTGRQLTCRSLVFQTSGVQVAVSYRTRKEKTSRTADG